MTTPPEELRRSGASYRHLLASYCDLGEAADMVKAYLEFANNPRNLDAYGLLFVEGLAETIEESLMMSAIIAYTRPFVKSRGGQVKLPGRFLSTLTREEHKIQVYLIEARNKILAHSDEEHVFVDRRLSGKTVVRSVALPTIAVIPGEPDSADLAESAARVRSWADQNTSAFMAELGELTDSEKPTAVMLTKRRTVDMDTESCQRLIGMTEKIQQAVTAELSLLEAEGNALPGQ